MIQISASERQFICEGVAANVRADGRARLAYRALVIETSLLAQSNGSARVSLENGGTDVLASVKLETAAPLPQAPSSGVVQVNVTCAPSVSAKLAGRAAEELNVELSQLLTRLLAESWLKQRGELLCLVPGESVWSVQIDVTVFESTGNLADLISMAIYAALQDTIFPSVRLVGVEGEEKSIEVDSDPAMGKRMEGCAQWPLCVTLGKVAESGFITDASHEEELCMTAQVSVAVDVDGNVCGVQKAGSGAIVMKELQAMIDEACVRSKLLFKQLDAAIQLQRQRDIHAGAKLERVGFLG